MQHDEAALALLEAQADRPCAPRDRIDQPLEAGTLAVRAAQLDTDVGQLLTASPRLAARIAVARSSLSYRHATGR